MRGYSLRRLAWAGPCATIIAIVATLFYYAVTRAFGEEYLMPMNSTGTLLRPMPATMPVVAIVFVGLVATLFFGLLVALFPQTCHGVLIRCDNRPYSFFRRLILPARDRIAHKNPPGRDEYYCCRDHQWGDPCNEPP